MQVNYREEKAEIVEVKKEILAWEDAPIVDGKNDVETQFIIKRK